MLTLHRRTLQVKAKDQAAARTAYTKAIRYLDAASTGTRTDEQKKEFETLVASCLSNRAQMTLSLKGSSKAVMVGVIIAAAIIAVAFVLGVISWFALCFGSR